MAKIYRTIFPLTSQEINRFWSLVDKAPGQGPQGTCWEWRGTRVKRKNGETTYGQFGYHGTSRSAHRIALFLKQGFIKNNACHTCDNPPCCNPDHLFDGTDQDNFNDMRAKNRHMAGDRHYMHLRPETVPSGTKNPAAILNDELVIEIANMKLSGMSQVEIASKITVRGIPITQSTISLILLGKIWKHVERPIFPRAGSSRFRGVTMNKQHGKWVAQITIKQEVHYLGVYKDEKEAALAYDRAAKAYYGDKAKLNFPDQ